MSSSNEMLIRSLLDECLGTALDEVDIAYMFKRGHLSPVKKAIYREPSPVTCESFCGGPSMCEVCQLPMADGGMPLFQKCNSSPKRGAVIEPPSSVTCERVFCGPSTCEVCQLPMRDEEMDFPLEEMDMSDLMVCKPCVCCKRSCRFKRLLFDAIGEALIYQHDDVPKTARQLQHVRGDLILALREVTSRLSHLENKTVH